MQGTQFETDLKRGQNLELIVKQLFESKGYKVVLPIGDAYHPNWDMVIYKNILTGVESDPTAYVEVKTDFLSAVTKNISIEHIALQKTKTTHFVLLETTPYLIKTADLEWLAYSPDFKQVSGGDDGRKQTLMPLNSNAFKEKFHLI